MKLPRSISAALTAVLLFGVFVEAARLADRHLGLRVDLSEDQLLAPSRATAELLRALPDTAQLELFVSEETESAPFQLTLNSVRGELDQLVALSDGRVRVVSVDPSRSSSLEREALEYGVAPLDIPTRSNSRLSIERAWLGGVVRYRGAEQVVPTFFPGGVEYQVVSAGERLARDRRPRLGWLVGERGAERFRTARDVLARRVDVVPLGGLAEGTPIDDLDAVCVVAPEELAPREVYELDQFAQNGGDLLLVLDRSYGAEEQLNERRLEPVETGLEAWLASHGVQLSSELAWDSRFHRAVPLQRPVPGPGGTTRLEQIEVPFPHWVQIAPDGFAQDNPATARLPGLPLRWAHVLRVIPSAPDGLAHEPLIQTSERSFATPFTPSLVFDAEGIAVREAELLTGPPPERQLVALSFTGSTPSPFAERGAPPARDPFGGPDRQLPRDAEMASGGELGRVVVLSDADWLRGRDGRMAPESRVLIENLVDWLTVSSGLLELRTKRPSDRSIRDFELEEFEQRGLSTLGSSDAAGLDRRSALEEEALAAADRRRADVGRSAALGSGLFAALVLVVVAVRRRLRLPTVGSAPAAVEATR